MKGNTGKRILTSSTTAILSYATAAYAASPNAKDVAEETDKNNEATSNAQSTFQSFRQKYEETQSKFSSPLQASSSFASQLSPFNINRTSLEAQEPRQRQGLLDFSLTNKKFDAYYEKGKKEFISNIKKGAKRLGTDLDKAKTVLYPLGQSDISTAMNLAPNAEKIVLTGANGLGPEKFDNKHTPAKVSEFSASRCGDVFFGYNSSWDFYRCSSDEFNTDKHPTLLTIAGTIHNNFGVNKFNVNKTEHGHSLTFKLNGKEREVEYVDFMVEKAEDLALEDSKKRDYIANFRPDVLINKAIPFPKERFWEFPSLIPTLTGAADDNTLVVSDQSFSFTENLYRNRGRDVEPTAIFQSNVKRSQRQHIPTPPHHEPGFEGLKRFFGYGQEAILTKGDAIIPLSDKRRTPDYINRKEQEASQSQEQLPQYLQSFFFKGQGKDSGRGA